MVTSVKGRFIVLETEFGTILFNNACVPTNTSGMDSAVWSNLNVAVGKSGINPHSSVTVLRVSTGMAPAVCYV